MEMMYFARKIHAKSDDLSKELVEFKSNGNTIVACFLNVVHGKD